MRLMIWVVVLASVFLAACQPLNPSPTGPSEVVPASPTADTPASLVPPVQLPAESETPEPEPDKGSISWEEAKALIFGGKVIQVFQLHNRTVTLTLADGTSLHTTEPVLDEVFRVIELCGEMCKNIMKATE